MILPRKKEKSPLVYVNPSLQLNFGLWTLFAGASAFLGLRIWVKLTRRNHLWYDDYILIVSWMILAANNSLITYEFATGYVTQTWDDRMHILINITSCGTLIGQALSKTAFAVTLIKLTKGWYHWVLWYCIGSMNLYMVAKCIIQWGKICNKKNTMVWYRWDFCLDKTFRDDFKAGGQIYNIIMDFVLASIPWIFTWNLHLRNVGKVGLCITMSLGMVVAIIAAVRTGWKEDGNKKDEWYFWRNAHSNIWYSSEIVGTIIVQCIPVLRPLLRDMRLPWKDKELAPAADITAQRNKMPADLNRSYSYKSHIYSNGRDKTHNGKEYGNFDSWDGVGIFRTKEVELSTVDIHSRRNSTVDVPSRRASTTEVYSQATSSMGAQSQKKWPLTL